MVGSNSVLDMQVLYMIKLLLGESIYFQRSLPYFVRIACTCRYICNKCHGISLTSPRFMSSVIEYLAEEMHCLSLEFRCKAYLSDAVSPAPRHESAAEPVRQNNYPKHHRETRYQHFRMPTISSSAWKVSWHFRWTYTNERDSFGRVTARPVLSRRYDG
jgi:hypothetical protein